VSKRAVAILPLRLRLPKLIFRHWTAVRKTRSTTLLVGCATAGRARRS